MPNREDASRRKDVPTATFHIRYAATGIRNDAHAYGKVLTLSGYYPVEATSLLDAARKVRAKVRKHRGWQTVDRFRLTFAQWLDREGTWHTVEVGRVPHA